MDAGTTFFDTADVYGDGRSERLIGRLLGEREEPLVVATKFGRRVPQELAVCRKENLRAWLERSRENLGVETVDLVQLHCPPWDAYYTPGREDTQSSAGERGRLRAAGAAGGDDGEDQRTVPRPDRPAGPPPLVDAATPSTVVQT